ncbi:SWIM zinc finger family protein [Rhodanobacter geophilus]|uniref:SWIM zinc finger family protein n=1 Tax=Rhodanobacter geophilus TaxID=3162488 RepID=A0ABV3QT33_9GAMM
MERMEFTVQGSAAIPYRVTLEKGGTNLNAYCTCAAGSNGQYCKHRFRILSGNPEGLVGPDPDGLRVAVDWLEGTDVESALRDLIAAEDHVIAAKKVLTQAKDRRAMDVAEQSFETSKIELAKARKLLAQAMLK